jgi:hypothetical protein
MADGGPPAVIPRHQKILFAILLLASIGMGVSLWRMRQHAHQRLLAGQDTLPTQAPQVAVAEQATLMVANDEDDSLQGQVRALPLPSDPEARARALLGKLLDIYAAQDATHPAPGGASSVSQVFLLPVARDAQGAAAPNGAPNATGAANGPQLAVVNLTSNFAASHPSGLETETLTVLSICGTLHANFPRIAEVRFLVDGQQRPTLAGHADLTRTYLTSDAVPAELNHP